MKDNNFTFIDLFAGIGGFRLALEKYNGKCVFSSEKDKYCKETYYKNHNEIPHGDIKKISEEDIPEHNVLCAGFPCQAFSISGNRKGFEDTRGTLFYEIARITDYHKPEVLLLENVRHLVYHDGGETFKVIKNTIEDMGYDFYYKIINTSYYGIPQSRKRVFMVCFRKDLNVDFEFPKRTNEPVKLADFLLSDEKTSMYVKDVKVKWKEKSNKKKLFKEPQFKPIRIGTVNKGGQGERVYDISGHAITLSAYGGGIFSKTGGYKVNGKVRKLAPRECARLMGFPDDFEIPVSDNQAYKQFGNSVVVPIVEKIFANILKTGVFIRKNEFLAI